MITIKCINGHEFEVAAGDHLVTQSSYRPDGMIDELDCPECQSLEYPDIEADYTDEEGQPDWWEQDEEVMTMLLFAGNHN